MSERRFIHINGFGVGTEDASDVEYVFIRGTDVMVKRYNDTIGHAKLISIANATKWAEDGMWLEYSSDDITRVDITP